jgi:hypothetical protein
LFDQRGTFPASREAGGDFGSVETAVPLYPSVSRW